MIGPRSPGQLVAALGRQPATVAVLTLVLLLGLTACPAETSTSDDESTGVVPVGQQWQTALAERSTKPAVWYSIGESLAEGQGASTVDNRWFSQVSAGLRETYGGSGSSDYLPVRNRVYGPDSPWGDRYVASSGELTLRDGSPEAGYGFGDLGHKAVELAEGASVTFEVSGTSVALCWVGGPGGGSFSYTVDGGPATVVSTSTAAYDPSMSTQVAFADEGTHTVVIEALGAFPLAGLLVHDGGETSGITTVDGAWSSATVEVPFLADAAGWRKSVSALAPDLVTIELGGNDVLAGTDLAEFRSQAQQLVDLLQSLPEVPSIYWVFPYEFAPTLSNAGELRAYQREIEDLVADDPSVGLIALADGMPVVATGGGGLYRSDSLHPNDAGQRAIAALVGSVVVGPEFGAELATPASPATPAATR